MKLPHTTIGTLMFAPPRDATAVDPSQPVIVQTRFSDVVLRRVELTRAWGDPIAGTLSNRRFLARGVLRPDARYTVTATVAVPQDNGPQGAVTEQTETISFATQTTPRIVGVTPTVVGPGKAAVVTFDQPASHVSAVGPVSTHLSDSGDSVALTPQSYHQGQTFSVSLTATNIHGVTGEGQLARFQALGGPSVSTYPDDGSTNMGVGVPLTVTLTKSPADPADFAGHFTVTADVTATLTTPVPATFPAPGDVTGTPQPDLCIKYAPAAAAASVPVAPTWVSPTMLRLVPKTPDGYWPPSTKVNLSADIEGVAAQDGSWFSGSVHRSFVTGDKRVIDVDLSAQTLTACRNGTRDNQFPVSTGTSGRDTPTGNYAIYERLRDAEMKSGDNPFAPNYYDVKHVPWTQYFHNGIALHGAWWHNNFGHPMSHGCVNVATPTNNRSWPQSPANAEYLWRFDNIGDPVIVHGATPA
jgi:lipoprotein-anchoring transpeptidase ErfK/SrfK